MDYSSIMSEKVVVMSVIRVSAFLVVIALCLIGGYGIFSPPIASANMLTDSKEPDLYIGALAWIEPKSRVLKIGVPNPLEGARVEELQVEEGDTVKKGQVLGILSTYKKNEAAMKVAESNLALAKANLEKVKAGSKASDILSQKQAVESLKSTESAAIKDFERTEILFQDHLVSKAQYDRVKADRDSSTSQRKSAEATLVSLSNVRPDDIAIAKANVDVAQAQLATAKADLDTSMLVAPIDGTILTIYCRNSESIGTDGALDIANLDTMDAVAEVYESDILRVKKGAKAEILVAETGDTFPGIVRDVGRQIKKNAITNPDSSQILETRIVEVRIELDKSKNDILSHLINKKVRAKIFP